MSYYIKKYCGIYAITNITNGMVYVGQSIDIFARWKSHSNTAVKKLSLLQKDIKALGIHNFQFTILELCSESILNKKEKAWIAHMKSMSPAGYNLTIGGSRRTTKQKKKVTT